METGKQRKECSANANLNNTQAKRELKVNFKRRNAANLLRAQIPRSNVGQDFLVSLTPRVISQKASITRRTLEAACWFWLFC